MPAPTVFKRVNPPLPPAVGIVFRLKQYGTLEGQMCMNTFTFMSSLPLNTAVTDQDLLNCASAWTAIPGNRSKMLDAVSSDYQATKTVVDCLTLPAIAPVEINDPQNGTVVEKHAPNATSVTFSRYTGTKGQHGRGKFLMPAVPLTWITNSSLLQTLEYEAFKDQLLAPMTNLGTTYHLAIATYAGAGKPIYGCDVVNRIVVRTILSTCRRRIPGRGK